MIVIIIIRASCPTCGDVRLSANEVVIRTCVGVQGGEYRWKCKCGIVVKQAEQNIIDLLRSSFVKEEVWELPLEIMERPLNGTLVEADIIDLELALKDGSFFDKLIKRQ